MQNGTIFEKSQNIFLKRGGVMAYLSDDELLDTEGGFTGWDDGTGAGAEETLEQALAEERLAVVLGTEGDGLAKETIADCDYTVCIPMMHGVDSLNVAAASAVAFWELGKTGADQKNV